MRYELLTDEVSEALQTEPYNPPLYTAEFTKEMFNDEWWNVRKRLGELLSQRARPYVNTENWGDFSLSESRGDSRWIWITFHTSKLWKKDFCEFAGKFLRELEHDYCIGCTTEVQGVFRLFTYPCIFLIIDSEVARGEAQKMRIFPRFGMVRHDRALRKLGFPV
jgi:hypothetical protein